jgi:hypothetical protein
MPLLRYFIYVGGALMALLLVVSAFFPRAEAVANRDVATQDVARPAIRIKSDRVVPPRVDLDTSRSMPVVPTLVAAKPPAVEQAPVREAHAQLIAPLPAPALPVKVEHKKTKIAKRPDHQRLAAYPWGFQPFQLSW